MRLRYPDWESAGFEQCPELCSLGPKRPTLGCRSPGVSWAPAFLEKGCTVASLVSPVSLLSAKALAVLRPALGASPWVSLDVKPRAQRAQMHEVYFLFPPLGTLTCLRIEPPSGREPFMEHGISALQHTETEISVALASFIDRCSHAPGSCRQLHSRKSFCSHWLRAS